MEWKREILDNICFMTSGGTPSRKNLTFFDGDIPWVKSGELENNIIENTEECITRAGLDNSSAKIFPKGTLLIALYGATIGKLAFLGINAATNQAVCGLFENEKVDLEYLYYYLYFKRPDLIRKGAGGAQDNISQTILKKIQVHYPVSFLEQHRIVSRIEEMFSELDNCVATLQKTKEQLVVYRQATISSSYPEMNTANSRKLMDISDITGGITKGRNLSGFETIMLPYLRVANVQNGYLDLSEIKKIQLKKDERDKYLLQEGDVLYTEGGDRDKLGRGTVWKNQIANCVHQNHVFRARIDRQIAIPEYVAYWSMGSYARNYFFKKGKQTVNLASINKTVLSNLELPIPDIETQRRTLNEIESRLSVCDQIETTVNTALQQAESMRQSILKQAFEGRL